MQDDTPIKNQAQSDVAGFEPVRVGPGSPVFAVVAFVAFIVAFLAIFNAFGATVGVVLAVLAIVIAAVSLLEIVIPRERGGRVSGFTLVIALAAVGLAILRLSGQSVLGKQLPADDNRATPATEPAALPETTAHDKPATIRP